MAAPAPQRSPPANMPVAMPVAQPVARPVARPVAAAVAAPVAVASSYAPPPAAAAPAAAAPVASAASSSSSSAAPFPVASPLQSAAPPVASPVSPETVDARLVLELPRTRAFLLHDGHKKLAESGTMQVLQSSLDGEEVFLLLLGKLRLALRQEVPCLEMAPRNYVFPTDSATYGVVLSESITDDVLEVFRLILSERSSFRSAAEAQPLSSLPDAPDRVVNAAHSVASGLGAGSVVVATGVIKGGRMVGGLLQKGGLLLTQKLRPNATPTQVSAATKQKLARAKLVSGAACKVSKALVVGALATTDAMASQLSAALKETDLGRKLATDPEAPNHRVEAAKHLGKSTLDAVLVVYGALESALFGVAADAASATVTVVGHKYGADAGGTAKESLGVVGDVAVAARAVSGIGVKSIAKKTAIKAGQDVLSTERERQEAAKRKAQGDSSSSSVLSQALGLPAGVDPLLAAEALQAAAQLSAVAAPYMAASSSAGPSAPSLALASATATGATPAEAEARATAAATKAAKQL